MSDVQAHNSHSKSSSKSKRTSKHSHGEKTRDSDDSKSKKRSKRHDDDGSDGEQKERHKKRKDRRKEHGVKTVEENGMDIVDDEEANDAVWVEKDVGGDGEYVSGSSVSALIMTLNQSGCAASSYYYSYCGKSQFDFPCVRIDVGQTAADAVDGKQATTRRMDDAARVKTDRDLRRFERQGDARFS